MTESVTPRAPDPPLVDPETGETAPLSPQRQPELLESYLSRLKADPERFRKFVYGTWDVTEPDDAA
jgi:hypothetical protein